MKPREVDSPQVLTVPEMARFLRIGRNSAYELCARGEIGHIRIGRSIRIPRLLLERYLEAGVVGSYTSSDLQGQ